MPNQELILLTHVPTESVNDGFLPAARRINALLAGTPFPAKAKLNQRLR